MFDVSGEGPHTIAYRDIRTIRFTGRDTAAGNSYAAWLRAKEAAKAGQSAKGV
jgi:ornithine cyclodeaminase/alanine dehydrogenase-like protein (mu-crystallin family)